VKKFSNQSVKILSKAVGQMTKMIGGLSIDALCSNSCVVLRVALTPVKWGLRLGFSHNLLTMFVRFRNIERLLLSRCPEPNLGSQGQRQGSSVERVRFREHHQPFWDWLDRHPELQLIDQCGNRSASVHTTLVNFRP
jgi:hypothetical protein